MRGLAGVEWSRRRTASQLQDLQTKQAEKLERLRSEQAKELEEFKDRLTRRHEATAKAHEAARLVAKYRDPLLRSAFDLQSRIWNVYEGGFRGGSTLSTFVSRTRCFCWRKLAGLARDYSP